LVKINTQGMSEEEKLTDPISVWAKECAADYEKFIEEFLIRAFGGNNDLETD